LARSKTGAAPRIALVGSETLLGKELEEVIKSRAGAQIVHFAATGEGNFGEVEGEAVYVQPFEPAAIAGIKAVIFAGSKDGADKIYQVVSASASKPLLVDCTGLLENRPEARIVAPLLAEANLPATGVLELAHPAAAALVLVLSKLARTGVIRRAIVHVFEPASEQGRRGVAELHQQTTSLLSFKPLEKSVFEAQLSFNLLSQYGEESAAKLSATEQRIERHIASLIATRADSQIPMPSLRLVAAPVFHSYSLSLWVEFDRNITASELREALASAQIEVRGENEEAPNGSSVAGQSGLVAGDIRLDRNNSRAAWLWVVGDNLRLTADAAADLIARLETDAT